MNHLLELFGFARLQGFLRIKQPLYLFIFVVFFFCSVREEGCGVLMGIKTTSTSLS